MIDYLYELHSNFTTSYLWFIPFIVDFSIPDFKLNVLIIRCSSADPLKDILLQTIQIEFQINFQSYIEKFQ